MKNIINIAIFTAILCHIFLLSCQRGEKTSVEGPTIALVLKTLNNPFFVDMERGAKEAAKKLGVNLIVQGAERDLDVEKQMQIMENLIQRKVDAICLVPLPVQKRLFRQS